MQINSTHNPAVDTVIRHIKNLLAQGLLHPGEKLPSERSIAAELNISRANVRKALQKLEFYGTVRTYPQSGTIVVNQTVQVLESLISDMLNIEAFDFASLVDVRVLLEVEAVRLCARSRTEEDIEIIRAALAECNAFIDTDRRVEKDFSLHQAIARASHNPVISSLLLVITPDVLGYYQKYKVCAVPGDTVCQEHVDIVGAIVAGDPDEAERLVRHHFRSILSFSRQE